MVEAANGLPPNWALKRPKTVWQSAYDLILSPLRMVFLPDAATERLHLTSLRAERFAVVLPALRGRCLDVGAGDNSLVRLYRQNAGALGMPVDVASSSIGVDIVDWRGGSQVIESSAALPFADQSFDTVSFVACLNHIPEREGALREARRVLRPNGRVVITMIGRWIGTIGHAIWWYSEEKHRDVDEDEEMGLSNTDLVRLIVEAGFAEPRVTRFVYGLNSLYVAERP